MSVREVSPIIIGGAQEGELKAVASGALANGKTVIVNSDGTVSVVAQESVTQTVGTPVVFESATVSEVACAFDSSNNKIVIAYKDEGNSNQGTAIVGTVSGTSISFGSPVVFESGDTRYIAATFDSSNNRVVIAYRDGGNNDYGTAIVGTVSGTSISFGSSVTYTSDSSNYNSATFDSTNNKVVIAYSDGNNSYHGTAVVGTVSGTSISFGTASVFETSNQTSYISTAFDSTSGKVVIAYRDEANSNYGTAVVATVSGTSISFGTPVVFESANARGFQSCVYDSVANKTVIAYRDIGNSDYGTAIVGTVSGTSISFGTASVFESASVEIVTAVFDSNSGKVTIAFKDKGNSNYGTVIPATVSGTSISFGTAAVFESANTNEIGIAFDSSQKRVVIGYADGGNSSNGTAVVFRNSSTNTNLTSENYIGISSGGSVADTENATVDIIGSINEDQSSLTAGQQYFVQNDGTLNTTADDPSVLAGTAISATQLLVKT